MQRHGTPKTPVTLSEDRVRRLRELLAMMIDRYGDSGPMVSAIRRNLARAEAQAASVDQSGQVPR